ncbi:MAG: cytochrome d ubiquinol oxidase subunit II [Burkholderiaceae bacterium]
MAFSVAFAVGMYVVLDGFDLGVGILFPFADDHAQRDQMMNSIAPFWDGNETWLVFGGAVLLSAFPAAFAVILPAVYLPIIVMLLGLMVRGVAFEFRFKHHPRTRIWDIAFTAGSMTATFAQGVVLGAFVQGIAVDKGQYAGGAWDWLTPFSVVTGLALLCGYALLGNTWLFWRSHGKLQQKAKTWMPVLLVAMLSAIGAISIWTPLMSPAIASRWFDFPRAFAFTPVPVLTLACAWGAYKGLRKTASPVPFTLCIGLFFLGYSGLAISIFPQLPPPSMTLFDAAASPESQRFLLPGIVILVPLILAHTWYNYRVFHVKGEHDEGYGH